MSSEAPATLAPAAPGPAGTFDEVGPRTLAELMRAGPMAPIANPYALYARLRREQPVADALPGISVFVSRYDDVVAVLRDHDRFASRSNAERGVDLSHAPRDPARAFAAVRAMKEALGAVVQQKRARRANDLISELTSAVVDGHATRT